MKQRPAGIFIICLLGIMGVVALVVFGFIFVFGGELVQQLMNDSGSNSKIAARGLGWSLAVGCWFTAAFHAVVVRGLFRLRPWARIVMILMSLMSLGSLFWAFSLWTLIVSGGTFWYLGFNPKVRAAFR